MLLMGALCVVVETEEGIGFCGFVIFFGYRKHINNEWVWMEILSFQEEMQCNIVN